MATALELQKLVRNYLLSFVGVIVVVCIVTGWQSQDFPPCLNGGGSGRRRGVPIVAKFNYDSASPQVRISLTELCQTKKNE